MGHLINLYHPRLREEGPPIGLKELLLAMKKDTKLRVIYGGGL